MILWKRCIPGLKEMLPIKIGTDYADVSNFIGCPLTGENIEIVQKILNGKYRQMLQFSVIGFPE